MEFDLVFEGGGAKGMVFVGAMRAMEESGLKIGRLMGTSAGAITAALIAAGYDSQEMLAAMNEREEGRPVFTSFMGVPGPFDYNEVRRSGLSELLQAIDVPFVPDIVERAFDKALLGLLGENRKYCHLFSFMELGGWYSSTRFQSWIEEKLGVGTFRGRPRDFSHMNFREFFEATGNDLSLVAADTTGGELLILNHRTSPDCPVSWGVRMSMSLPLIWSEIEWRPEWGAYRGRRIDGNAIVDGGVLSSFPIEFLVSAEPFIVDVMGDRRSENVIGLLIDESLDVPGAPPPTPPEKRFEFGRLTLMKRMGRLVDTMMHGHDKKVTGPFEKLVVRLPAKGYGTTEFDMSDARKEALVAVGRDVMHSYLLSRAETVN